VPEQTLAALLEQIPFRNAAGTERVLRLAIAPSDGRHFWVATGAYSPEETRYYGTGTFRSTNAGLRWQPVPTRFTGGVESAVPVAIHPRRPNSVFFVAFGGQANRLGPGALASVHGLHGIFMTTDGGLTWRILLAVVNGDVTFGRASQSGPPLPGQLRLSWMIPIDVSRHHPNVIRVGAHMILRSTDGGSRWAPMSPDLSASCAATVQAIRLFCTTTHLAESPLTPGLVWAGTDAGAVWVTTDDGRNWTEVTRAIAAAGGPADGAVSALVASPHNAGTALVAKLGPAPTDARPHLYRTSDFGRTWTAVASDLPARSVTAVALDRKNEDVVAAGTTNGAYISADGGASWAPIAAVPLATVRDVVIHEETSELVLSTEGRGLWIADISPLQRLRRSRR
jgi:photosystem II stability/assembly factor-like uncharacterized protein